MTLTAQEDLQIASCISVACSGLVLLTLLVFRDVRKKLFMQIIAFISFADLCGNLPFTFNYRAPDNSFICSMEGFANLYFYPCSWMWTTMLTFYLYSLAVHGVLPLSNLKIHLICWGFPLLFSLLTLTTNNFKRHKSPNDVEQVCTWGGNTFTGELWHGITYYGLWFGCFISMMIMYNKALQMSKTPSANSYAMLKLAINALELYPLAMIVCWLPHVFVVLVNYFYHTKNKFFNFYVFSNILKILHGAVTALIFFYKSPYSRSRWKRLFMRCYNILMTCSHSAEAAGVTAVVYDSGIVDDFSVNYETEPPQLTTNPELPDKFATSNIENPVFAYSSRADGNNDLFRETMDSSRSSLEIQYH